MNDFTIAFTCLITIKIITFGISYSWFKTYQPQKYETDEAIPLTVNNVFASRMSLLMTP